MGPHLQRAVSLIVDKDRYNQLEFLPATTQIPCVPPHSGEAVQGPISWEYFIFFPGQLPNRTAPGLDWIPQISFLEHNTECNDPSHSGMGRRRIRPVVIYHGFARQYNSKIVGGVNWNRLNTF